MIITYVNEPQTGPVKNDLHNKYPYEILDDTIIHDTNQNQAYSKWFSNRPRIMAIIFAMMMVMGSTTVLLCYHHYTFTLKKTLISDRAVVTIFDILLTEHQKAMVSILESYASRQPFINAVKSHDKQEIYEHLSDLKINNSDMDLTFITDRNGICWANYPVFPEAYGKDFSNRDWYKGISENWKPFISPVFKLIVGEKPLAVAICVPIRDENGNIIGILGNSHRLSFIDNIFKRINFQEKLSISVIDQMGKIVFSNKDSSVNQIMDFPLFPLVRDKLDNGQNQFEVKNPDNENGPIFLSVSSENTRGWTVVLERRKSEIIKSLYGYFSLKISIAFLLFFLVAFFLIYQHSLFRKTADLLKTEIKLKNSKERFKRLIENVPDILYVSSLNKGGIYYSPSVTGIMGYSPDELYANPSIWKNSIHPDDLDAVNHAITHAEIHEKFEVEYRLMDRSGNWHWVSDRATGLFVHDDDMIIEGLAVDITRQKLAEEALQDINREYDEMVTQIPVGICKYRIHQGKILEFIYVSPRWCSMMKMSRDDILNNSENILNRIHPDDIRHYKDTLLSASTNECSFIWDGRFIIDGQVRHMKIESIPKINDRGELLWTALQYDITVEKNLEVQHKTEKMNKVKSLNLMAGSIAHKFNNLLSVVMGNLEIAMDDNRKGCRIDKNLGDALKATHDASEVSRMMLTYLGQTIVRKETLNLTQTCNRIIQDLQSSISPFVQLKTDLPKADLMVQANTFQIQQVLNHLLTNASEAIGEQPGEISFSIKTVYRENINADQQFPLDWNPEYPSYACLSVTDTGCGILHEDIDKLFDPFFTSKFTGRGLGLPVVLGLIRAYNGGITVESTPGAGSTFNVYLPLIDHEKSPEHIQLDIKGLVQENDMVLLVEDEFFVRKTAKTLLTQLGLNVIDAKDGSEALTLYRQHMDAVKLVFSDLTMPHMDGWELLSHLRKLTPSLPVILVSGYDQTPDMMEKHDEKPQAFLTKPYRMNTLREMIITVLKHV